MSIVKTAVCIAGLILGFNTPAAQLIYQTGFEPSEGYNTNSDLVGQKGWVGAGSGGNGLITGFFDGKGYQAYVGYGAPLAGDSSLFVYQPINKKLPLVQFSTTMSIVDSTTTNRDDFYWGVFNQQGQSLFTIDFDNFELKIYYYLDNTNGRTWSGLSFTNDVVYPLTISLDFSNNRWSATFNGATLVTNQPITTAGATLDLGDIDAAWAVYDVNSPGDNFMLFDDYRLSASAPPAQLSAPKVVAGVPGFRVTGSPNLRYAVDASTNLSTWSALTTNIATTGFFDFADSGAVGQPARFYRARWVP